MKLQVQNAVHLTYARVHPVQARNHLGIGTDVDTLTIDTTTNL